MGLTPLGITLIITILTVTLLSTLGFLIKRKLMEKQELTNLAIAIVVLTFSFSAGWRGELTFDDWFSNFLLTLLLVTIAIGIHEVAHRIIGNKYDAIVRFKLWTGALGLSLLSGILTAGNFVFAGVGAVSISNKYHARPGRKGGQLQVTPYETGKIASSGPLANLFTAALAKGLMTYYPTPILSDFMLINIYLAVFNVIPWMISYFVGSVQVFRTSPKYFLIGLLFRGLVGKRIAKFQSEGEWILWGSRLLWFFVFSFVIATSILLFALGPAASISIALLISIPLWLIWFKKLYLGS